MSGLSPHSKKDGALATEGATLVIGGSHNNTNVNSPPNPHNKAFSVFIEN